jgi:hypothetical protein
MSFRDVTIYRLLDLVKTGLCASHCQRNTRRKLRCGMSNFILVATCAESEKTIRDVGPVSCVMFQRAH